MGYAISIVIPVHNEQDIIEEVVSTILLHPTTYQLEIILVDDGSTDNSRQIIEELAKVWPQYIRAIILPTRIGQAGAISAGCSLVSYPWVVLFDGDGQNEVVDIHRIVNHAIVHNYDLVIGRRIDRKEKWLGRRLPSWLANLWISLIIGQRIHDSGSSLKCIRSEHIRSLNLGSRGHRFIPILLSQQNPDARIGELLIVNYPRKYGRSKYGLIRRTFWTIIDLMNYTRRMSRWK
jgi:glycosyltransferase involved in cell wall biosynthesis